MYDSRWLAFVSWCEEKDLDPTSLSVTGVLEYLQGLVKTKKLATNTLQGYVTAISDRHDKVKLGSKRLRISELTTVQSWVAGLKRLQHVPRVIVPSWELDWVLSALKEPPYFPLETASLKELTLRTVFLVALTSARRASEIHAIQSDTLQFHSTGVSAFLNPAFIPKVNSAWHINQAIELPAMHTEEDSELRKFCLRRQLRVYLNRTASFRTPQGQLFLCYGGSRKGKPVSKIRISQWLKELINDCYERHSKAQPLGVKGHQVRKQATSWADAAGVDPQTICDAATWKTPHTFARHYQLDLQHGKRASFGKQVLRLSVSSAAEHTVASSLGRPTSTAGGSANTDRYRIPKLKRN